MPLLQSCDYLCAAVPGRCPGLRSRAPSGLMRGGDAKPQRGGTERRFQCHQALQPRHRAEPGASTKPTPPKYSRAQGPLTSPSISHFSHHLPLLFTSTSPPGQITGFLACSFCPALGGTTAVRTQRSCRIVLRLVARRLQPFPSQLLCSLFQGLLHIPKAPDRTGHLRRDLLDYPQRIPTQPPLEALFVRIQTPPLLAQFSASHSGAPYQPTSQPATKIRVWLRNRGTGVPPVIGG